METSSRGHPLSTSRMKVSESDLERSLTLLDDALNSPSKSLLRVTKSTPLRRTSLIKRRSVATPDVSLLNAMGDTPTTPAGAGRMHDLSITFFKHDTSFLLDNATTTGALFLGDQPWKEASDHLYMEFLESMQVHGSEQQVFETVLDFIKNCNHTIETVKSTLQNTSPKIELQWLYNESDTWGLVFALYKNRLGTHRSMEQECPARPLSEKETVIELYNYDNVTRECQLVVDWLERNAEHLRDEEPCMEHYTDKTIMWENTLHQLQNNIMSISYRSSRPIISKLDPDAPLRERKPLHDLDMEDEAKLLKAVYYEIRCGRLERAKDLCIHCGQPWRAALLEGWRLHHDPNYDTTSTTGEKQPMEGNRNRDLWKLLAWRTADDTNLPPYARAIHAALCGHLVALEAVCNNWQDLLWAYLRVMVDIRVEKELRTTMIRTYVPMPEEYWQNKFTLEEVFTKLGASRNQDIGDSAKTPDFIVQKYLILDHIPQLMEEMLKWSKTCSWQFLRFLAHLVLFFRMVGRSVREDIGHSILEAYVKVLMKMREPQLVAFYVSTLPQEDQVTLYAEFLEDVTEENERLLCLDMAEKADLDVQLITKTVVETIRSQDWSIAPPDLHPGITPQDEKKISALEWVVFYPEQRVEAMWQANALIRHFLAVNKLEAARKALKKIPINSISLIVQQYQPSADVQSTEELSSTQNLPFRVAKTIREYLCHRTYLDAQEGFADWFHHYHNAKPSAPVIPPGEATFTERVAYDHRKNQYKMELDRWKLSMQHQTKTVKSQLYNVLMFPEGGWLVDNRSNMCFGMDADDEDENEDKEETKRRQQQLESLRQLCIPQVTLLLLTLMHNMGEYSECIHLADLIVSEQYELYKVYPRQKLGELLNKISESSLELLNEKRDSWGHPITF